jgi:TPR repeat protein
MDILAKSPEKLYQDGLKYLDEKDYDMCIMHMTMAANYDYAAAKEWLFVDYETYDGIHLKQNYSITKQFYENTVEYGYSADYLGYMYHTGEGVPQDYTKAKKLYEMAIEKGVLSAMNNLGFMYNHGEGVPQDYAKAKELYKMSVEKGNVDAMNNLGYMYQYGGVPQDYTKAKELYEMSAEKGNVTAIENLGKLYKSTDLKNNMDMAIDSSIKIGKPELLTAIYGCTDMMAKRLCQLRSDNQLLKDEVQLLKAHIDASPDGELFLETLASWTSLTKK